MTYASKPSGHRRAWGILCAAAIVTGALTAPPLASPAEAAPASSADESTSLPDLEIALPTATGEAKPRVRFDTRKRPGAPGAKAAGDGGGTQSAKVPCGPGTGKIGGTAQYTDHAQTVRPARWLLVEIMDQDGARDQPGVPGDDDVIGYAATNQKGEFVDVEDLTSGACFAQEDEVGGKPDVYLRLVTENNQWAVYEPPKAPPGQPAVPERAYEVIPPLATKNDVPPGAFTDFATFNIAGEEQFRRAVYAYDQVNVVWEWLPDVWPWPNPPASPDRCWDVDEFAACKQKIMHLYPENAGKGANYNPVLDRVILDGQFADEPFVVAHELAHAIMDDVYQDQMPGSGCPPVHQVHKSYSALCAWQEGFASWVAIDAYGVADWYETATWGTGSPEPWADGDTVEGRVTSAMVDISDVTDEKPWDRHGEGAALLWSTFQLHQSSSFQQFWTQRAADGFDVSTNVLASLYQNTIDYGFREPMTAGTPIFRSVPNPNGHNYSLNTKTAGWSVIALDTPNADYDLTVFDDKNQTAKVASSETAGTTDEFVAMESGPGKRPLGDYYPRVTKAAEAPTPAKNYSLQFAESQTSLAKLLPLKITMSTTNKAAVVKTEVTQPGVPITITATPAAGQTIDLFVVQPGGAGSVRTRATAIPSTTGPAGARTLTFTPQFTGAHGVIVTISGIALEGQVSLLRK
ncbi:hypothetical protein [Streptomyces sp. NPDC047097]|uniref:hypothetical protein n=1 Tax=Streptomyces sp. NPDC047097 TaxID=3155260 RepID=UPI0033E374ED